MIVRREQKTSFFHTCGQSPLGQEVYSNQARLHLKTGDNLLTSRQDLDK